MNTAVTYKAYEIVTDNDRAVIRVHDPRYPNAAAVYVAATVADAKEWVNAYRAGVTWAVMATQ